MSGGKPRSGFILAAGKGTRLRPYTDHLPKPMVPLDGAPLIDRVIAKYRAAGVERIVANTHYCAAPLEAHVAPQGVTCLYEPALLETGGGLKNALPLLGDAPFYVASGDGPWTDPPGAEPALDRLAAFWDDEKMDLLMLLQPLAKMSLTDGVGDYDIDAQGRLTRSLSQTGQYMWTSVRIVHPRLFAGCPDGAFSFLELMDKAQAAGRLYGLVHHGDWFHISTPADLESVEAALADGRTVLS